MFIKYTKVRSFFKQIRLKENPCKHVRDYSIGTVVQAIILNNVAVRILVTCNTSNVVLLTTERMGRGGGAKLIRGLDL